MKHKFLENSIESKFIKALLHNAYIPTINTVSIGDYIIKDIFYIYNRDIVKCNKSGYIGTDAMYTNIKEFYFGLPYPKYTTEFISKSYYYDSETHRQLGEYLRCYKDINDVDLMPFYNCFTGKYLSGIEINETSVYQKVNSTNKIFQIPIRFNKTYTIALDSYSTVYMAPVVMNDAGFVTVDFISEGKPEHYDLTEMLCNKPRAIVRNTSMSFKNPITYRIENTDSSNEFRLQQYEKDLYLLIQVSSDNDSSLVVLEGDYTNQNRNIQQVWNIEYADKFTVEQMNVTFLSPLSLLMMNDKVSYPYADRLIEYLLENVIDTNDTIGENIKKVQHAMDKWDYIYPYKGVWTNKLRCNVYKSYKENKKYKHLDNNGFIDKDVEKYLLRKEVEV